MDIDPHFKTLLEAEAAAAPPGAPPPSALPVDLVRAGYSALRVSQNVNTSPAEVASRDFFIDGAAGPIKVRLYTPAGYAAPGPLLVYFHGGGFVIGDLDSHDAHCRRLSAGSGAKIMAVDYRLAPEHPFPASHDDALAATRWAFDHAAEIDVDPARIGVGGDSAGGNLAAVVSHDLRGDPRTLKFQLLLYPALWPAEMTQSRQMRDGPVLTKAAMTWFEDSLAAQSHADGLRAAPAQAKAFSGLPAALVVTAGHDPLEHEGRDYVELLTAAGVPARHVNYPSLVHDFFVMGDVSPAVLAAAAETASALKAAL
jgi:acetyl esterase